MAIAHQYDLQGYYAGAIEDFGLLPNNATRTAPAVREGFIPLWKGTAWEQVEDHRGKSGYVNGRPFEVKEPGPLPEGWSDTPPEPAAEEKRARRAAEIKTALQAIDAESARAMRAILAGTATEEDQRRLADLESRAVALRQEQTEPEGA